VISQNYATAHLCTAVHAVPKYIFSMRVLKVPICRMYLQTAVENNLIYFIFSCKVKGQGWGRNYGLCTLRNKRIIRQRLFRKYAWLV